MSGLFDIHLFLKFVREIIGKDGLITLNACILYHSFADSEYGDISDIIIIGEKDKKNNI